MTGQGWSALRWTTGRLALLGIILAVLVGVRLLGDESKLWFAELTRFMPEAALIERLESGRQELAAFAQARTDEARFRLETAASATPSMLDHAIAEARASLDAKQRNRRSDTQRALALLTGQGFTADLRDDIEIRLLTAELESLQRLDTAAGARRASVGQAAMTFDRARQDILAVHGEILATKRAIKALEHDYPVLARVPGTAPYHRSAGLRARLEGLRMQGTSRSGSYWQAKQELQRARSAARIEASLLASVARSALQPVDDLIATMNQAAARTRSRLERVEREARNVFWSAVAILMVLTLAPIGVRAFWYYVVAPAASRRAPIRLLAGTPAGSGPFGHHEGPASERRKVSAVSQDVRFDPEHELLVHPRYLQSSPDRAAKDTKWLWNLRLPFTSLASGMVALTRIRATTTETAVISDTRDPFGEIGLIPLPPGSALALKPRSLVGVVQRRARPVAVSRHWRLGSLSAWLTLQFRYLVFHGPATLIVQGCRGIRVEPAGRGRSIDQAATIGFSANLAYSTTRSETFGAYLMGKRGLFNDNFAGGPGIYVYEEMPYRGRRTGITGRGLEGVADAVLRALGV